MTAVELQLRPMESFKSKSMLEVKELTIWIDDGRIKLEIEVAALGNGVVDISSMTLLLLASDGRELWRFEDRTPQRCTLGLRRRLTSIPPAGFRVEDVAVVEVHDVCMQKFPQELLFQVPVVAAAETGAWTLGDWRRHRWRGPTITELSARHVDDGLALQCTFATAPAERLYEALELCVLATTEQGAELERATAQARPGSVIELVLPLSLTQRARVRWFDVRLGGEVLHVGALAQRAVDGVKGITAAAIRRRERELDDL